MALKSLPTESKKNRHTRGNSLTSHLLQYHIWAPYQSGFRGKIMVTITGSTTKVIVEDKAFVQTTIQSSSVSTMPLIYLCQYWNKHSTCLSVTPLCKASQCAFSDGGSIHVSRNPTHHKVYTVHTQIQTISCQMIAVIYTSRIQWSSASPYYTSNRHLMLALSLHSDAYTL